MIQPTPFDAELEEMIIGNVFVMKRLELQDKAISTVDFFVDLNQKIWSVIVELDEDGESIEIFEVHKRLNIESVKMAELMRYTHGLPGYTDEDHVRRLKDLATLRELMRTYDKLIEMASKKQPVSSIIAENENLIDQVRADEDKRRGTSQHLAEVMEREVFPRLDRFVSGDLVKIPFGFPLLDDSCNGGASLGELVIFGALPKSGKSAFILQTARQIAELKIPTQIMSREMLNYENGLRFLAQSSGFSVNSFRSGMHEWVATRLKDHGKSNYHLPLYFDHKSRTVKDLSLEIQRLKGEIGLTCVCVDYIQLVVSEKRNSSRAEKLEEIVYALKDLAVKHEIVVYANAQFNREGIKSGRPNMSHFEGSSAIEKAANLAIFWTLEPSFSNELQGRPGTMWIEAGRSVGHGEYDIVFHGKEAKFSFYDKSGNSRIDM